MLRSIALLVLALANGGLMWAGQQPGVWLNVPFIRQEKNGCGSASIAMVMQYWEHQGAKQNQTMNSADNAGKIQLSLASSPGQEIYASAMERYFQQHEYRTFAFAGDWTSLKEHLEKGRPLIVALKPGHSSLHYVVVVGLDWQQNVVLKNDPAERKLLKQDRINFEKEWKAAGNWTLLAVPRQGDPGS
jgi:uncharacterized protein YvpB